MEVPRLAARDLACRRGDRVLFADLSLALDSGETCHVTGANGTGKSSLIRILAGLLRPFEGKVRRTGSIGLIDERLALDEHMPLGRALAFWHALDGGADGAKGVETMQLGDLLDVPVRYLSTGQRKRASLARLVASRSRIWLLDEPLNGLDADARGALEALIAQHCGDGGIALVASHQPVSLPQAQVLHLPDYAA
ncbi:heme ABC exporter ATP-binding protein CcmA [Aurantiacibacter gangjinensis]|uniref:Cytochrome C biogenesis protein CcmA n=1 Tax=Aurantiacibacter gangjinensis TaxID=502682 RepID=A0A0G9MW07_9SPHN|nr:heme ABC exporter ATP-binding protein CcmA [Aurantiacibacter gangjinensis]APE27026.1 ABC transporter involved in cytochrome c biogenesis, ATPase component CcmA [Aurantiacibacter gangjinensis]KLE33463.1 cytochrome C biogenesis protein CcmA [Aurantiacibacter gangjinensis]